MDVVGLVSGRGPELPFVTSIDQIELLASGLIFELGSELQFGKHQSDRTPRMFPISFLASCLNLAQASCMFLVPFLVSFLNLAPSSRLWHLSIRSNCEDVSELNSEPGSELPFATPVDQIELRGCLWSRFWSRF